MIDIQTYEPHVHVHASPDVYGRYDPTKTLTLRNAFVKELKKRFRELKRVIRRAVDTEDVFGLREVTTHQLGTPGHGAFDFARSEQKMKEFERWLQQQIDRGLLQVQELPQVGVSLETPWTNRFVTDAYKRGVIRARYEMRKAGYDVPTIDASGGIEYTMSLPVHVEKLGLLYTRVFSELRGITAAMDQQISRVLADGMAAGDNPRLLAKKIVASIDGQGIGELGLRDTLGRYIAPERRAEIMARTEIVRAHHQATIQEYRNWRVEGVEVQAEWKTAGDERVCDQCSQLEGSVWTLDQVQNMIPVHPQCFIDPQIPIYTSKGWKPIGNIQVGDLVLTHRHRFRKVDALVRQKQNKPDMVKLKFRGDLHLSMTANHPVLVTKPGFSLSRWIEAKYCTPGMYVKVLGNTCKRCGKPIPYFRKYCSRTCLSKDITDKQWSDPNHRKLISRKAHEQLIREYDQGTRDRYKSTQHANQKIRKMVKEGTFGTWMDKAFFEKIRQVTNTPEHRKNSSERMKRHNPMFDPSIRRKATQSLIKLYRENPERRLNARMAKYRKSGRMTDIERTMASILDSLGVNYVFQYPILRYDVDFAIPNLKIAIECDGEYWHRDKEADQRRQEKIEAEGWTVLRYTDSIIYKAADMIEEELSRVLCNHTGQYLTVAWEIEKVEHYKAKRNTTTYNFSVEEDESYMAKGVVVHNCRCIALPYNSRIAKLTGG